MDAEQLKDLLDKYLAGELSGKEEAALEQWFATKQMTGKDLFDVSDGQKVDTKQQDFNREVFERIEAELNASGFKASKSKSVIWSVAASILLVIGLGMGGLKWYDSYNGSEVKNSSLTVENMSDGRLNKSAEVHWKELVNTDAHLYKLVLPDGSLLQLYPGSVLRYDSLSFNRMDRKLYLKGKGFFDVAHNAHLPFMVYSRGISTMALGTAFMINAYDHDDKIKVDLIRGKVRIRKETTPEPGTDSKAEAAAGGKGTRDNHGFKDIILVAGQYFSYDIQKGKVSQGLLTDLNPAKSEKTTDEGKNEKSSMGLREPLIYDRAPLAQVMADLTASFNVRIAYDSSQLSGIQFSGTVRPKESLEQILKKISLLNDLVLTGQDSEGFKLQKQPH